MSGEALDPIRQPSLPAGSLAEIYLQSSDLASDGIPRLATWLDYGFGPRQRVDRLNA